MDLIADLISLKSHAKGDADNFDHTMLITVLDEISLYSKLYQKFPLTHPVIQKKCPHLVSQEVVTRSYIWSIERILSGLLPLDFPTLTSDNPKKRHLYEKGLPFYHWEQPPNLNPEEDLVCIYQLSTINYALFYYYPERYANAYGIVTLTVDEDIDTREIFTYGQSDVDNFTLLSYSMQGLNAYPIAIYRQDQREDWITLPTNETIQIGSITYSLTPLEQNLLTTSLPDPLNFKTNLKNIVLQKKGLSLCND